jgi:hypothetical protein
MIEIQSVLKKAAEKSGLVRVRYKERNMPTSAESVVVLPFFGDRRSSFVLSSILLKRIKEELKGSKYFVLASWPGNEGLFPYVDEYWQVEDESVVDKLKNESLGFFNHSSVYSLMQRNLNQFFYDVMTVSDISVFYNNGLTKEFFERFKHVKVTLPAVPSSASLGIEIARTLSQRDSKVFVYPSKEICSWRLGGPFKARVPKEFWVYLLNRLVSEKFFPVVLADSFSYDISPDVPSDCLHLKNLDIISSLGAMRSCGCVVDLFCGISRYALAARTPYLCFDERIRFNSTKEYEINDLCGIKVPKEYIFGFAAILESGDKSSWNSNIFDHLVVKLKGMYETMDRDSWPSSAEREEIVPYDSVRKIKNKKLGSRFIKVDKG